jgi:Rieske Fe-S protein
MADKFPPPPRHQCATRRGLLLGAGLVGVSGALAACSTAPVPYDANEEGQAPDAQPAATTAAGSSSAAAASGGGITGTVLGQATQVPVGGGTIFTAEKVVVTQPTKGQYKAFSAICTHVGCLCNAVASGTIDCPCHGSKFSITNGSVVAGPAPSPLPARTIAITNGKIVLQLSPGGATISRWSDDLLVERLSPGGATSVPPMLAP